MTPWAARQGGGGSGMHAQRTPPGFARGLSRARWERREDRRRRLRAGAPTRRPRPLTPGGKVPHAHVTTRVRCVACARALMQGSAAYVGGDKAVFDVPKLGHFTGWTAGVVWKSFETFSQFSFRNQCLVASDW